MFDAYREALTNQFEAALSALGLCVEQCPDEVWNATSGIYTFNGLVFHTLFYTDYYLGPNEEALREQPFHRENREFFGDYEELEYRDPVAQYERAALLAYAKHCQDKLSQVMASETNESLSGPSGFPGRGSSRGELHIYNIRHVQHHAGQLSMRLRADADIGIPWVFSGEREG